ncbi:MAG TPA: ribonuclease P protein component [Hyphomicrobium sp.]|nr:ribonuclease P protein component [Hyphomicrobium sp.]
MRAIAAVATLKVRAEFLAVRGGVRASVPSCLIEARKRRPAGTAADSLTGARFGFTVTKKLGNAVKRNRIRRRLKAAISELAPAEAKSGYDYVVVARSAAFDRPFADIRADLTRAFAILNRDGGSKSAKDPKKQTKKPLT